MQLEKQNELNTEQKLRAENFKLRVQVHNLTTQLSNVQAELNLKTNQINGSQLIQERDTLKKELEFFNGDESKEFDWDTLSFVDKKK